MRTNQVQKFILRARQNPAKIHIMIRNLIVLFVVLFLAACDTTTSYWEHSPFSKIPPVSLEQAQAICKGAANNAGDEAAARTTSTTTQCDTYNLGGSSVQTNCRAVTDPWEDTSARERAYQNTYTSCMATNGWRAELRSITTPAGEPSPLMNCRRADGATSDRMVPVDICLQNGGTPF